MVYCINVSDSRGVPETIYCTCNDDCHYFEILQSSQDELIKNGFFGSLSHQVFDKHVFSKSDFDKIVKIIRPHFYRFTYDLEKYRTMYCISPSESFIQSEDLISEHFNEVDF